MTALNNHTSVFRTSFPLASPWYLFSPMERTWTEKPPKWAEPEGHVRTSMTVPTGARPKTMRELWCKARGRGFVYMNECFPNTLLRRYLPFRSFFFLFQKRLCSAWCSRSGRCTKGCRLEAVDQQSSAAVGPVDGRAFQRPCLVINSRVY